MGYADAEKQREYQRNWVRKRRSAYFEGKTCVKCGSIEDLEVDHIDPTAKSPRLKGTIGALWSWRAADRIAELAKCQVLCAPCHLAKTLEQRRKTDHGHAGMYQVRKCRCELCRLWKRNSDKKYRDSHQK